MRSNKARFFAIIGTILVGVGVFVGDLTAFGFGVVIWAITGVLMSLDEIIRRMPAPPAGDGEN